MSDGPPRLLSLSVLGGALHGRTIELDAVDDVLIGSDPGCRFHVDLPAISPIHARLWVDLTGAVVHDTRSPAGVFVNFDRVEGQSPLQEGDMIWLGPPQEPGSVLIQCRFAEAEAAADGAPEEAASTVPPPEEGPAAPVAAPEPAVSGFDDFFAAHLPTGASEPAGQADFVVAGFAAPWPEESAGGPPAAAPSPTALAASSPPVSNTPSAPASAASSPDAWMTEPGPSAAEDDPFFIGEGAPKPAAPPAAPAGDAFFVDEEPTAASPLAAEPMSSAAEAEPVSFPADEFFVEPAPVAAPSGLPLELPPLEPPAAPAKPAASKPVEVPRKPADVAPQSIEAPRKPADVQSRPAEIPRKPGAVSPKPQAKAETPPRPPGESQAATPVSRRPDSSQRTAPVPRPEAAEAGRAAARPARGPVAARRPSPSPLPRYLAIGAAGLALLAGLAFVATRFLGSAEVASIEPARARTGQTVTLAGKGFAADPQGNVVLFGDTPGTVLKATEGLLEVVVPEVVTAPGQEVRLPVLVRVGRAESRPVELAVFAGPTLHGISPDVAMPGEEVLLAGVGWGPTATVRFGAQVAEVLEVRDTSIKVRVPPILGGPGSEAPVIVSAGGSDSNPAPFYVGRIPLVFGADPPVAAAGDVVAIRGRGFPRDPQRSAVAIGGVRALVLSVLDDDLRVVVPRLPPATEEVRPIEVRVAGSAHVGQSAIQVASPPATVDFRFVAEPFDAAYGKSHAVLATGLGPAFVVAASGGKTAATRAAEAQRRLNDAASVLRATPGLNFEVQTPDTTPVLALAGRPERLLEVTEEDAAAYGEDWTGLRGRGGPVTRTRLARWWEAVASDLVLILVRSERPRFAAALAPEGRVLADVFQAGQRAGGPGLPLKAVAALKPGSREALRLIAFRVPPTVPGPATPASAALAPAAVGAAPLRLEGAWVGSETEDGRRRNLTATFGAGSGRVSYEGTVTLTVPLSTLEQPKKDAVRFSLQIRGGIRYYNGHWDGQTLSGTISRDPEGTDNVATFTLRPR